MGTTVTKIHHVAYRCKDALVTARWYKEHLDMDLVLSIAEDNVPSTGEADPYMHIFLDAGMGNVLATKERLQKAGIDVLGPTDHAMFQSIYFFDPNGHRIELAANTAPPGMLEALDKVKWEMLEEWAQTKRAPKHAAWLHDGSYKEKFK